MGNTEKTSKNVLRPSCDLKRLESREKEKVVKNGEKNVPKICFVLFFVVVSHGKFCKKRKEDNNRNMKKAEYQSYFIVSVI